MILFALKCTADHRFEAWFRNGAAYDEQAATHQITCPVCGDTAIAKAPMAPRIAKGVSKAIDQAQAAEVASASEQAAAPPVPAPAPIPSPADIAAALPPSLGDAQRQAVAEVMRQLTEVRRTVEKNCDYVGDRFAEEARRIHYGESDPRGIYGEASAEEVEDLNEEGVAFHRIPWIPRTDS